MKTMKVFLLILGLAFVAACSTSPIAPSAAKPVKALAFAVPQSSSDVAVTFVRDSGMLGFECQIQIWVNKTHAITLSAPSEKSVVWLHPNTNYVFTSIDPGHGMCPHTSVSLNWNSNMQITTYRVGGESQGTPVFAAEVN